MQHWEHHVDAGVCARLGKDGTRLPAASLGNQNAPHLVEVRIHRGDHRFRRAERDLMLAAASAANHRHPQTAHKILFPKADKISSTASNAVRLASSITGFTSTASMETISPLSHIISMAKCASR